MKKLLVTIVLLSGTLFAQRTKQQCATMTFLTSGSTQTCQNDMGGINTTFEERMTGAPSTVSIVIKGCMRGGTCDTLDTYTTVAASNRQPSMTAPYDYYSIQASWTGGTSPVITVNATVTMARGGSNPSNINGTLTPNTIPVATAAHVLGDSSLTDNGSGLATTDSSFTINHSGGQVGIISNGTPEFTANDGTFTSILEQVVNGSSSHDLWEMSTNAGGGDGLALNDGYLHLFSQTTCTTSQALGSNWNTFCTDLSGNVWESVAGAAFTQILPVTGFAVAPGGTTVAGDIPTMANTDGKTLANTGAINFTTGVLTVKDGTNNDAVDIVSTSGTRHLKIFGGGFNGGTSSQQGIQAFGSAPTLTIDAVTGGIINIAIAETTVCSTNGSNFNCVQPIQQNGVAVSVGSVAYLTSNYTNATTTMSSVTGLSFSVSANTNYKVRCDLDYQTSAATADVKLQWTGPASPTSVTYDMVSQVTGSTLSSSVATSFSSVLTEAGTPTTATNFPLTLTMTLINGANAGTVQLQAAATGTGTITIIPGSCSIQK